MSMESKDQLNCYPKYLLHQCREHPDWIAVRRKDFGIWNNYTWEQVYEIVSEVAMGLLSLGLKRGDRAVVIGDEEPEGFWAIMAIQCAGGVPVPLYSDAQVDELSFLIPHSEARFVFAEDQEQVDKILELKEKLVLIEKVIWWDHKGMRGYGDHLLVSYEQLKELGRSYEKEHPGIVESIIASLTPDDTAQFTYTSGTTGLPKASIIPHRVMVYSADTWQRQFIIHKDDGLLSVMPWGSIFEQWFAGISYTTGAPMCFCEEPETVRQNIREISPRLIFLATRQWVSMSSEVQIKVADAGWLKRFCYHLLMPVGYRIADARLAGREPDFIWRLLNQVAEFLVFKPVRDKLGFVKTRYPICGSTYISPDVMRFYYALGMPLYQVYGSTESGINITHSEGDVDIESIGRPPRGTSIRISEEGEIQTKSPGLFTGYYKNVEATANKMTPDGYYRTGDAGFVKDDGHIVYIDRVDDLRQLKNGHRYSPGYIEGKLKFSPYIQEAIALGDSAKDYISVIVIVNFLAAGKWAEDHHIGYTNFPDLSQKEELGKFIKKDLERINHALPEQSRIKKYVLLHKEFDADDAEITRSRKLRRKYIEEKYSTLIDAIYRDNSEFPVEAAVKYRDGRTGTINTSLKIREV
jgi:long-chain acyl-CoA synthetase